MKEIRINAIKNGTVIDHIPSDFTFKVAEILDIPGINTVVSVASNLQSDKLTKKGIIKVEDYLLQEKDVQKIALIAPDVTLSIIENYQVSSKKTLTIPDELNDIVKCINKNCITNIVKTGTKFIVETKEPLCIRCFYCERSVSKDDLELL